MRVRTNAVLVYNQLFCRSWLSQRVQDQTTTHIPVILEPQVKDLDTYKTWTSVAIYFAADNDTSIRHDPVVYLAIFPLARPRYTLIMYHTR